MTIDDLVGAALPLTDDAYAYAAGLLGVRAAKVRAVVAVESRGRGFHPDSRRPIILYEPHIFSRRTGGRFDAAHPDLSYPAWGQLPYPASQGQRWAQLGAAMALDEAAALESASWGLFQIMGFHAGVCGFASVQAFARAMAVSEGGQLEAFVRFVCADAKLLAALRAGDWAGFARRYNGPGYAQHGYDQKLKVAFAQFNAASA